MSSISEGNPAAAAMQETVCRRDWARGQCQLRLSACSHHGLPVRCRPFVSAHLHLQIDRYYLEDGRPLSHRLISLPIEESRLATTREATYEVLTGVLREYYYRYRGWLPVEALTFLAERLSDYICDVAATSARAEAVPFLTVVDADAHVWMLVEEEEQEQDDEHDGEVDYNGEPPSPRRAAPTEMVAMDGQLGGEGGEDTGRGEDKGEGERCSICLGKMEAAGGDQRRRCWLPCSHSFHRGCVGRWLRHKAQCPLCRLHVSQPAA